MLGGDYNPISCAGVWVRVGLIEQKETVNIYKSGCGRAGGQGWVLLRPPHTGPDWIIRNELANVTNVTSITRTAWQGPRDTEMTPGEY